MPNGRPILIAAGAALGVAILGGAMTDIGPWYRALEKSALNPPDWAFAPAWTLIYALAAAAAVVGWRAARRNADRALVVSLFAINALLNVLWSFFFFAMKRPDFALAEVATLWLSVLALIIFFTRLAPKAALILAPYLAWVTYAAHLNFEVVRLNPPFGGGGG